MTFSTPGVTADTYVSYMCSPYHIWFVEMGYPRLDLNIYEDGEWEIIEYLRTPVVPSLTPWHRVLMDIRHTEINPWFCKKYVENLDLEKRWVWDEQDRREEEMRREMLREELHVNDFQRRAFEAVRQNPALMDRIARNGLGELSLQSISRQIPNFRFRKDVAPVKPLEPFLSRTTNAHEHATLCDRPESSGQGSAAGVALEA